MDEGVRLSYPIFPGSNFEVSSSVHPDDQEALQAVWGKCPIAFRCTQIE